MKIEGEDLQELADALECLGLRPLAQAMENHAQEGYSLFGSLGEAPHHGFIRPYSQGQIVAFYASGNDRAIGCDLQALGKIIEGGSLEEIERINAQVKEQIRVDLQRNPGFAGMFQGIVDEASTRGVTLAPRMDEPISIPHQEHWVHAERQVDAAIERHLSGREIGLSQG